MALAANVVVRSSPTSALRLLAAARIAAAGSYSQVLHGAGHLIECATSSSSSAATKPAAATVWPITWAAARHIRVAGAADEARADSGSALSSSESGGCLLRDALQRILRAAAGPQGGRTEEATTTINNKD